jgi:hypothetical protein
MLASSSSGSHTPPPTRAGGVLKRLRQILWEGVGRDVPPEEAAPRIEPTSVAAHQQSTNTAVARPPATVHARQTTNAAPPSLHHEHLLKEALKRMNKHSPLQTRLALVNEVCEYSRSYRCVHHHVLAGDFHVLTGINALCGSQH